MKKTTPTAVSEKSEPRDMPEFRAWLQQTSGIGRRSQNDVCSRLRRLSSLTPLNKLRSEENVNQLFKSGEVASEMTVSVRSQLKLTAKKYVEFLAQRRK